MTEPAKKGFPSPSRAIARRTTQAALNDASRAIRTMDEICSTVFDYTSLLGVLLAGPDAETVIDGMHRLVLEMRAKADDFRDCHDSATRALNQLAANL
jgi:hypothetical protein